MLPKTQFARQLRQSQTDAEAILWRELRNRNLNDYKFVRQFPLGPYITDLVCRQQMLVVELDGSQHAQSDADQKRDRFLLARGYSILRFWNHEVLEELEAVLATILVALEGKLKPEPPLRYWKPAH
ncbi:MAG: endonuclease domain-containing protein [Pseudomonadota bacterium]